MCEKLYMNLEDMGYCIMEGGPGMGKTSMLQCLLEWAANKFPDMHGVYINLKRQKSDFQLEDVLSAHLGCPLDDIMRGGYSTSASRLAVHWSLHVSSLSCQILLLLSYSKSVIGNYAMPPPPPTAHAAVPRLYTSGLLQQYCQMRICIACRRRASAAVPRRGAAGV